jgi:A118 family predicted phage portal protein
LAPTQYASDQAWPPPALDPVMHRIEQWSAWFSGDPDLLYWTYYNVAENSMTGRSFFGSTGEASLPSGFPGRQRQGLLGTTQRTFWGSRIPAGEKRTKLHVPLAGDIAAMSAALLFAKRPVCELPPDVRDDAAATWFDALLDDDMHATLLEGAEVCAGLSGVYLRANWDTDLTEKAWIDVVHPDAAVPTFTRGILTSVVLWRVIQDNGSTVVRHLETHDLRAQTIHHSVYAGTQLLLGAPVPLGDYEATAQLEQLTTNGMVPLPTLPKGAPTVVYVPNIRPNRLWRNLPEAAHLGRSDYAGITGVMDSLDETYSLWVKEVRLARLRLIVPQSYMDNLGPGKGAILDLDREAFVPMNMLAGNADTAQITPNQFAIRWQEHLETCKQLIGEAVTRSGYSQSTFGESGTTAMTATEVEDRQRQTLLTRAKKLNYVRPRLRDIVYTLMCLDQAVYGQKLTPVKPDVTFPDAVLPSTSELAQTAVALNTAQAASKETLVQLVHPDWTADQVAEEVAAIKGELGLDLFARARLSLTNPPTLNENIGQQVQDITGSTTTPDRPDLVGADVDGDGVRI